MPLSISASRRVRWIAASAFALVSAAVLFDHWQRRASGPQLQASSQHWPLVDDNFQIQPESLRLQSYADSQVLTGRFSRTLDAAPNSLPPGALLETLLPQWQQHRSATSRQLPLPSAGNSMQAHLLEEALRSALENAQPTDAAEDERTQALQRLNFRDRQFIAHLSPSGPLQITASWAAPALQLHAGSGSGQLLLGAKTEGQHWWSQSAFSSSDQGQSWKWSKQQQLPEPLDQFGWVQPQTAFAWNSLEQALLISYDGGSTWGQPPVHTPLTMAAVPESTPPPAYSAAAWHARHALKAFTPAVWGDLAADPLLQVEYETLLTPGPAAQLRGWSIRWARTLDEQGSPQGNWQAALTRRFTLLIPPAPEPIQVQSIETADDIAALPRYPSGQLMRSSDGSLTWLQQGKAQHLDPKTWRWQAPVDLPRPAWHHTSTSQLWTGNQVWISRSSGHALLDIASCLLPARWTVHERCNQQRSHAFHFSRDQGHSWQGFELPHSADSHIVGWNETQQMLLVAEPSSEADKDSHSPALSLRYYALP